MVMNFQFSFQKGTNYQRNRKSDNFWTMGAFQKLSWRMGSGYLILTNILSLKCH